MTPYSVSGSNAVTAGASPVNIAASHTFAPDLSVFGGKMVNNTHPGANFIGEELNNPSNKKKLHQSFFHSHTLSLSIYIYICIYRI
jgi:hypothetical protein